MDLQLSRLSTSTDGSLSDEDACGLTLTDAGSSFSLRYPQDPSDPNSDLLQRLSPDNRDWRQLVTQLAPAVAPAILAPVTTTGPAGFDVSVETNITGISDAVAETIVDLGIDWQNVETQRDLHGGLMSALERQGMRLVNRPAK